MQPTDGDRGAVAPLRPGAGRTLGLIAALAVLLFTSYTSMRSERAADSGALARLVYDTLVEARQYHILQGIQHIDRPHLLLGAARTPAEKLTLDMRRLATMAKTARSWRRLAIVQAMVGDPDWMRTVERIPGRAADEPAFWKAVLGDRQVAPQRVPAHLARLATMDLGWFRHIAAEKLYANARMTREAEREREAADRSFYRLSGLGAIGAALSLLSCAAVAIFGIVLLARRRDSTIVLPEALRFTPPDPPLTAEKARVLYDAFVVYLATFIAIRYVRMAIAAMIPSTVRLAPAASAAASLPFLVLALAVPLLVLRLRGRRVGLRAADIGFRRGRLISDIACGAVGWLATVPLLVLVTLVSTRLFHGYSSPDNPAITEYAGTHSFLVQALLFAVAAVYAPLAEETMFRGVFLRSLTPGLGVPGAIAISAAVFAMLHPQLPVGFAGIFILGVLFAALFQARGSLTASITAHALNNAAIFVLLTLLLAD